LDILKTAGFVSEILQISPNTKPIYKVAENMAREVERQQGCLLSERKAAADLAKAKAKEAKAKATINPPVHPISPRTSEQRCRPLHSQ